MTRLFGTDGVRGLAGVELTPEGALALGRAAAAVLGRAGRDGARPRFVLARDTRASGPMLEDALASGLLAGGCDIVRLGVAPTPAVAHLVPALGVQGGAVVSASHNPAEYNGIKFLDAAGRKLADDLEDAIEAALAPGRGEPTGSRPAPGDEIHDEAALDVYVEHLAGSVDRPFAGERVVLDCAHGAATRTAPVAFRRAGLDPLVLNDRPDGWNVNDGCGSQHPEALARAVVERGAAAGFAFDGDADRCIAVDERGRVVDGDGILAVLALDLLARGALPGPAVVATIMSNLGLERALAEAGIRLWRAPVGDRHVLEAMVAGGYRLGGEPSGHIVILDHATTGDGALTALQIMCAIRRAGRTLGEMASVVRRVPQAQRNVRLEDGAGARPSAPRLEEAAREAERRLAGRGRVVVRPSGTEPVVRILVEGDDEREVVATADWLEKELSRDISPSASARAAD